LAPSCFISLFCRRCLRPLLLRKMFFCPQPPEAAVYMWCLPSCLPASRHLPSFPRRRRNGARLFIFIHSLLPSGLTLAQYRIEAASKRLDCRFHLRIQPSVRPAASKLHQSSALAMVLWYHPRLISERSPVRFRLGAQKLFSSLSTLSLSPSRLTS
jgi:hypothetical protein